MNADAAKVLLKTIQLRWLNSETGREELAKITEYDYTWLREQVAKALLFALLALIPLSAGASRFPANSNTVDPLNYGAVKNDGLPDTVAIQDAARASILYGHVNELTGNPGDRYVIDAPIKSMILHGLPGQQTYKWVNNWIFLCDPGVEIYIPPNTPAFSNAAAPQGIFQYGSTTLSSPTAPPASGGGNEGYRNTFDGNCTIRVGAGNPGACGIDWVVNNRGALRGVTIIFEDGQGDAGVCMGRPWPGPAIIENVTVLGAKRCIRDGYTQYGIVYKDVTCAFQTVYGVEANGDESTFQNFHSENTVPGIRVASNPGHLVCFECVFSGGLVGKAAIELGTGSQASIFDSTAAGSAYSALIKVGTALRTDLGLSQTQWLTHPGFSLFDATVAPLNLPSEEPPIAFDSTNPADWADPRSYGSNPNDRLDDRAGIVAAIATGKPILQLVQGHAGGSVPGGQSTYYSSNTLDIPCSVKVLEGMESKLVATTAFPLNQPALRLADPTCTAADVTVIRRLWPGGNGGPMIELNDKRTVYIEDAYMAAKSTGIHAMPGSGKLFLKNVVTSGLFIRGPHQVIAWQFNPENFLETEGILNDGGSLLIYGMKTEGLGKGNKATLTTLNNGQTEIRGGMMMPCVGMGSADVTLGFVVIDSDFSATYMNHCGKTFDLTTWDEQVRETRAGVTRSVLAEQLPTYAVEGGNRVFMTLFSARGRIPPPPPEALLVVGNPAALAGLDAPMRDELEELGFDVVVVDDTASSSADATDKALVVIAPSVALGAIGTKFRDVPVPVLINKGFGLPAMAMSTSGPAGYVTGKTQVNIVNAAHPLAACLPVGLVTVYPAPARVQHGRAEAAGVNVAKPQDFAGAAYGILGYEAGVAMVSPYVAQARRVGFFGGEDATGFTADGWQLFDAAVLWAAGETFGCGL